jgi:hypothetical protein
VEATSYGRASTRGSLAEKARTSSTVTSGYHLHRVHGPCFATLMVSSPWFSVDSGHTDADCTEQCPSDRRSRFWST